MNNQELYKQAILDAKAVRETAMAAARTTLAEHFEPYVKETMTRTLSEDDDDMVDENYGEQDENFSVTGDSTDMENEATLDEILAELDGLSEDGLEEGKQQGTTAGYSEKAKTEKGKMGYDEKAKVTHGDHKLHEAEDDEAAEDDESDEEGSEEDYKGEEGPEGTESHEEGEENTDEQEVVDITVGELKDIIRDVFMQIQGGGEIPSEEPFDAGTDLSADLGGEENFDDETGEMDVQDDDEISLDEILAELEAEDGKVEENTSPGKVINPRPSDVNKVEFNDMKKELNEAVKTIKALTKENKEMNLFNAKMLYVNKVFKAKNLNESQKTKVVNAFDRATTVKEVENTYKTILESISTQSSTKTSLKESISFASKPIGNAPARPIVEADAFIARWQQLAGIKP